MSLMCNILLLFSHNGIEYPCALVHWFLRVGDLPDIHTGMWDGDKNLILIIHLNTIVQPCHLIPVFSCQRVSRALSFTDMLNKFTHFYVNKYVDHHAFEVAF